MATASASSSSPPVNISKSRTTQMSADFNLIDEGLLDQRAAFDAINSNSRRVATKVEFSRERADLILPPNHNQSCASLATSSAMESMAQRATRFQEVGQQRDEHA